MQRIKCLAQGHNTVVFAWRESLKKPVLNRVFFYYLQTELWPVKYISAGSPPRPPPKKKKTNRATFDVYYRRLRMYDKYHMTCEQRSLGQS